MRRHKGPLGTPLATSPVRATQPSLIKAVQRGTITINGATAGTATITAVDVNNSRLRLVGWTSAASPAQVNNSLGYLVLTNSTTVTANVQASPSGNVIFGFEITEYYPGVIKSVQRGTITIAAATATINPVNTLKSEVDWLGNSSNSAAGANSTETRMTLTNATTVTMVTAVSDVQIGSYQVVEFY